MGPSDIATEVDAMRITETVGSTISEAAWCDDGAWSVTRLTPVACQDEGALDGHLDEAKTSRTLQKFQKHNDIYTHRRR